MRADARGIRGMALHRNRHRPQMVPCQCDHAEDLAVPSSVTTPSSRARAGVSRPACARAEALGREIGLGGVQIPSGRAA